MFAFVLVAVLLGSLWLTAGTQPVYAASGQVYSCTVVPSYANPKTGEIEDSGGKSAQATGQGMVEGSVGTTGLLEVTDSGEYYLTIRMSLMDYTENHSFQAQDTSDSAWSDVSFEVTQQGSDSNGTTADICIKVPSENCLVRGSMRVTPMGRDVIFFFYPSDYKSGNSTDMKATKVTEASTGGAAVSESSGSSGTGSSDTASGTESASTDDTLDSAQGLGLSTAPEDTGETSGTDGDMSMGKWIVVMTVSMTVAGLILLAAATGVVYYFRRNWNRIGGEDFEDEE